MINYERGTTALEVMVALLIFSLAATGLALVVPMAYSRGEVWNQQFSLARLLETELETTRNSTFAEATVGDTGWLAAGEYQKRRQTFYGIRGTDSQGRSTWQQWAGQAGNGLSGYYYNDPQLTNFVTSRVDSVINFDWGPSAPVAGMKKNHFSIRWRGFLRAPYTDKYTFSTLVDDGVRLWVDNQLLINQWENSEIKEFSGAIDLVANHLYPLQLEYREQNARATIRLDCQSSFFAKQIIPQQYLYSNLAKIVVNSVKSDQIGSTYSSQVLLFNEQVAVVPPEPDDLEMHLASFELTPYYQGRKQWGGRVTVGVHDQNHRPLAGVRVEVTWVFFLAWSSQRSVAVTDENGLVKIKSPPHKNPDILIVNIDSLEKNGYTYNQGANEAVTWGWLWGL